MIARLVKQCALWLIIIGTISWATAFITGNNVPTFIGTHIVDYGNGITTTLYTLDVHNYLRQLQHNIEVPFGEMFGKFPEVPTVGDNILKVVPNFIIYFINVFLWIMNVVAIIPTKLLLQPIILICSLLGIDLEKHYVIDIIYIVYRITIPPIPYV